MNMNLIPLLHKAVLRSLSEADAREAAIALITGEMPASQAGAEAKTAVRGWTRLAQTPAAPQRRRLNQI